ncbi:hypothetical protein H4R35_001053 [Dimargaris xerosporica]|nr:hypothetical protein H4R35_001053 [Dimargaris xerosporica]
MGVDVQDVGQSAVPTHSLSHTIYPSEPAHESILQATPPPRQPGSSKVVFSSPASNTVNAPTHHGSIGQSKAPHIAFGTLPDSSYFPDQSRDACHDSSKTTNFTTTSTVISHPGTNTPCDPTTSHPPIAQGEPWPKPSQNKPSHCLMSASTSVQRPRSLPKDHVLNPTTSAADDVPEPKRRLNSRDLTLDGIRLGVSQLPPQPYHELKPVQDYVPTPYVQLDSFVPSPYDAGTPDSTTTPHQGHPEPTEARYVTCSSSDASTAAHHRLPRTSAICPAREVQSMHPCPSNQGAAALNHPQSSGLSTTLHNLAHRMAHKLKPSTDHHHPARHANRMNNSHTSAE